MSASSPDPFGTLGAQLQNALGELALTVKADIVTAFVYDEATARFHLPTGYGLLDENTFYHPQMTPSSGRVAGMIARERRTFAEEQVPRRTPMDGPFARRERVASALGCPLMAGDRVVGVLFVSYRTTHRFDNADKLKVREAATGLAEVIARADPFAALAQIATTVPAAGAGRFDPVLKTLVNLTCDAMTIAVALWRIEDGKLALVAGYGLPLRYLQRVVEEPLRLGGTWFADVLLGRAVPLAPLRFGDAFPYPREAADAGWKTALALPVVVHDRVCGVVEGFSFEDTLDPIDRRRLERLAELTALTFENVQREAEAVELARVVEESSQASSQGGALKPILEGARKLTRASSTGISLKGPDGEPFVLTHPADPELCDCAPPETPMAGIGCSPARRAEAPVRVRGENIGTLYACSDSGFTDHDRSLLGTFAKQAAGVLGMHRQLLRATREIEEASAQLFDQQTVFRAILRELRACAGEPFDFTALHLIRGDGVIEAVCGLDRAKEWVKLAAAHEMDKKSILRDIHADIVQANPLQVEVITQWDPKNRFDKWIFKSYGHEKFVRAFVPVVIARDHLGRILDGDALNRWLATWTMGPANDELKSVTRRGGTEDGVEQPTVEERGRRETVELKWSRWVNGQQIRVEVIGTVEAGYVDYQQHAISTARAFELAREVVRRAPRVYRTTIRHVLQTVVDCAVRLLGAAYASLYLDPATNPEHPEYVRYGCEVFSAGSQSKLTSDFLRHCPPRRNGLGERAIESGKTLSVPGPGEPDNALESENPEVYRDGITAIVAVPLPSSPHPDGRPGEADHAPRGVLYVGFRTENGTVHRFAPEETDWLERFVASVAYATRHATAFTRARDEARQLANLQQVVESLVRIPENPNMLNDIAWSVLNVLGASVVTIYQYDAATRTFRTPPAIAGRLMADRAMDAEVYPVDSPALVLGRSPVAPVYAQTTKGNEFLDPCRSDKEGFVEREGIISTAAVPLVAAKGTPEEEVVGLLYVNFRRQCDFPDSQRVVIESLAAAAATALKTARLLEVFSAHHLIASAGIDEQLTAISKMAAGYTRAECGEVCLIDRLSGRIATRCQHPACAPASAHAAREAIIAWVMGEAARWAVEPPVARRRWPRAALVRDYTDDRCGGAGAEVGGSEFCVPLVDGTRCLGVLRVCSSKEGAFAPWHERALQELADQAVLAVRAHDDQEKVKSNEKLSTMGALTGTLLHRLKVDLLAIAEHARMGREADEAGQYERARQCGARFITLADEFYDQVQELRDWDKAAREPVALGDALRRGLALAKVPNPCVQLPDALPQVSADPKLLAEVFAILARNGVEEMRQTPGSNGQLTITVEVRSSWAVVRVTDTGRGIDELSLGTLFKAKHSSKPDGLGIGLFLAHSYVELIGGKLAVETGPGGSTFLVGLPTTAEAYP